MEFDMSGDELPKGGRDENISANIPLMKLVIS